MSRLIIIFQSLSHGCRLFFFLSGLARCVATNKGKLGPQTYRRLIFLCLVFWLDSVVLSSDGHAQLNPSCVFILPPVYSFGLTAKNQPRLLKHPFILPCIIPFSAFFSLAAFVSSFTRSLWYQRCPQLIKKW